MARAKATLLQLGTRLALSRSIGDSGVSGQATSRAFQCLAKWKPRQSHAINLVLSGPGTGKSRMLDEMKGLLCEAAARSENQELMDRMKSAYVFNVTFENGTSADGSLLNREFPGFDISYRMLYQLYRERHNEEWSLISWTWNMPLTIGEVITMLAKLEKIEKVKDMTVILCVDGLQKVGNNDYDMYKVLASICSFLNSSIAFAVCVCSATVEIPVVEALASSHQIHEFLVPPVVCGKEVLKPKTRLEKLLVEDMGGHGRALEALQDYLKQHKGEDLEEVDSLVLFNQVRDELRTRYSSIFNSDFFQDPSNIRKLMAAILSRREYDAFSCIGDTGMTVDWLRSRACSG